MCLPIHRVRKRFDDEFLDVGVERYFEVGAFTPLNVVADFVVEVMGGGFTKEAAVDYVDYLLNRLQGGVTVASETRIIIRTDAWLVTYVRLP